MRKCLTCYRKIRVNRLGCIGKHYRGMETCPGSGQKVAR